MSPTDLQKQKKRLLRRKWLFAAATANIFFVITLLLHVPLESYIGNISADEFWFHLTDLLPSMLLCAAGAFAALEIISLILPVTGLRIFSGLIFGFTLSSYLQVNFLNPDYGLIGVTEIDWSNPGLSAYISAAVWCLLCIGVPFSLLLIRRKFMRTGLQGICAILCVMQLVSGASLIISTPQALKNNDELILTSEGLLSTGTQDGSMLVLIVDTMDNVHFDSALSAAPDLIEIFDGFTRFSNCTGSYSKTAAAVPYLISGIPNTNEMGLSEFYAYSFAESEFLKTLQTEEYDVRFFVDMADNELVPYADNTGYDSTIITDTATLYTRFMQYVGFRTMPELAKQFLYFPMEEFFFLQSQISEPSTYSVDDVAFYQKLVNDQLEVVDHKTFRMIRLYASHAPFTMDAECNRVEQSTYVDQNIGALRIVQEYLEQMKASGVYDSTSIIVLADHSRYVHGDSVFLAKPAGSRGPMQTSTAPISHEDLHNTLLDMAGLSPMTYGKSVFDVAEDEERVRTAWLYNTGIMHSYLPESLPPLWEIHYGADRLSPQYTGVIYAPGEKQTLADIAIEIEWDKAYGYDDLPSFLTLDTLTWGSAAEGYINMNNRQGKLFFRVPHIPADGVDVTLSFMTYIPSSPRRFRLEAAGMTLYENTFTGQMDPSITFHIPAEAFDAQTNLADIELYMPDSQLGTDNRVPSFAIKEIKVSLSE